VLRMAPPLIVSEQDINDGLAAMTESVKVFLDRP
jgi:4-aminobutyrate aminotransferase-like enzyme